MQERESLGVGLLLMTVAAVPVLFFLLVLRYPLLAGAALLIEVGLFVSCRIALRRPQRSLSYRRDFPPR